MFIFYEKTSLIYLRKHFAKKNQPRPSLVHASKLREFFFRFY